MSSYKYTVAYPTREAAEGYANHDSVKLVNGGKAPRIVSKQVCEKVGFPVVRLAAPLFIVSVTIARPGHLSDCVKARTAFPPVANPFARQRVF